MSHSSIHDGFCMLWVIGLELSFSENENVQVCAWFEDKPLPDPHWQMKWFRIDLWCSFVCYTFCVRISNVGVSVIDIECCGFFLICYDFVGRFNDSFSRLRFFTFLKEEISSRTEIPFYRQGSVHSGSVSWDDSEQAFPDELYTSSFPDRFQHCAWIAESAHSDIVKDLGKLLFNYLGQT